MAGVKLRSPELIGEYKFLKKTENWSVEELESFQLKRLKSIVEFAYNNSTFYHDLFDSVMVKPDDIEVLSDIKKLPIISKSDLLTNANSIQNKKEYRKVFLSETSGSTGEPLVFYRNSEWDAGHRAAQLRGYSWYGVKPWELNGYFWGYSFSAKRKIVTKIFDKLLNRFRLFSYEKSDIEMFSKKLKKAIYLEGYSSMIYEVAKFINKGSIGPFNLKMVKGTSEKIYDCYQEEAKLAFGQRIISEYGSAETGIIAYECKMGRMHIVMENVIVEEEEGEIIVTNLISNSFPIIRYRLGDNVMLDNETVCSCGMQHKIVKDVLGRVGKVIYGKNEKYPSLTLYYIFKNITLKHGTVVNYQAIQKEKGKIEIYLDRHLDKNVKENILKECKTYYSHDLDIDIYPNALKREYDKKFRDFISEIN